jgi:hypothetical protein
MIPLCVNKKIGDEPERNADRATEVSGKSKWVENIPHYSAIWGLFSQLQSRDFA